MIDISTAISLMMGSAIYALAAAATYRSSTRQFVREYGHPKCRVAMIGAAVWPLVLLMTGFATTLCDSPTAGFEHGKSFNAT